MDNAEYDNIINNKESWKEYKRTIKRKKFRVFYETLNYARKNNNRQFINEFLDFIRNDNTSNNFFDNLLLFIFDDDYRNDQNYQELIYYFSDQYYVYDIIYNELNRYKKFSEKEEDENIVRYLRYIEICICDDEINEENIFEYINFNINNGYYLVNIILLLRHYEKDDLCDIVKNEIKKRRIKIFLTKESLKDIDYFDDLSEFTYYKDLSYDEVRRSLKEISVKMDLPENFSLDEVDTLCKIYSFSRSTKDNFSCKKMIDYIMLELPSYLRVDLSSLPLNASIEIDNFEDLRYLDLFVNSINDSNREDIKIIFPFESVDDDDEVFDILMKLKNKNNLILNIYGKEVLDGQMVFSDYIKARVFYETIVETIKEKDFSPLEMYIYVYNLVKSFKKYRFYNDNHDDDQTYSEMSRNKYIIIGKNYIVCAGYVNMMVEIMKRLEFPIEKLVVHPKGESIYEGHARVLSYINDPKYNVDGVFIGDPTWDNTEEKFYHMLLNRTKEDFEKEQGNINDDFLTSFGKLLGFDILNDEKRILKLTNQRISPNVLKDAFRVVWRKTYPNMSGDEIEYKLNQIYGLNLPQVNYDTQLKNLDNIFFADCFENFLTDGFYMNYIGSVTGGSESKICVYLQLKNDRFNQNEVDELIVLNQDKFTNEYVTYEESKNFRFGEKFIKLTLNEEMNFRDFELIVKELSENLNNVFTRGLSI